jgi:hypothetical protein
MPLRTPPMAARRQPAHAHATALTLAAMLALLIALLTLGSTAMAAEEPGCPHGPAPASAPCPQVSVAAPTYGHHPGHGPSSTHACLVGASTHRTLCHSPLPAVGSPAPSGLLPGAVSSADPAPGTVARCHPRTVQRQILRC